MSKTPIFFPTPADFPPRRVSTHSVEWHTNVEVHVFPTTENGMHEKAVLNVCPPFRYSNLRRGEQYVHFYV